MKFKGTPNLLVRITKAPPALKRKLPKTVRFDSNGVYETNNIHLIKKLKSKFELIEEEYEQKELILSECSYKELQVLYAEKTGNSAVGKRKADILIELEE